MSEGYPDGTQCLVIKSRWPRRCPIGSVLTVGARVEPSAVTSVSGRFDMPCQEVVEHNGVAIPHSRLVQCMYPIAWMRPLWDHDEDDIEQHRDVPIVTEIEA